MRRSFALPLSISTLLVAAVAVAATDLSSIPGMGETVPAFGLLPLNQVKDRAAEDETKTAIELDQYCGVRRAETKAVVLYFFDLTTAEADLTILQGWAKKYGRMGLETLAVSEVKPATLVTQTVEKGRYSFPVLDDHLGIVADRFGIPGAPFFFLLDGQCKLIAFSDKSISADKGPIATGLDALMTNKLGAPVD